MINSANCFCDKSCANQLTRTSTGISSGMPFSFNEFEFEQLYHALSTLLLRLLHLATVGLRHSGHVISILAYILGKFTAITRNYYNQS